MSSLMALRALLVLAFAALAGLQACGRSRALPPDGTASEQTPEPTVRLPPGPRPAESAAAREARERLVRRIARERPWTGAAWSDRVLLAMRSVPRHLFVPGMSLELAYADTPQPIGHAQTISQPSIVAIMTQALELDGGERVLEIGTGSGYQAAILSVLARDVFTVEILEPLGEAARARLVELGYANVQVRIGDGYAGWPEHAPFDRVLLTACPPELPRALVDQLADGGRLVAPVGPEGDLQRLVRWKKRGTSLERTDLGAVRFVPMVRPPG